MTEVKVKGYVLRRLTCKEKAKHQARWTTVFRGGLRFFRTRQKAVNTILGWPPVGFQCIKA